MLWHDSSLNKNTITENLIANLFDAMVQILFAVLLEVLLAMLFAFLFIIIIVFTILILFVNFGRVICQQDIFGFYGVYVLWSSLTASKGAEE